MKFVVVEGSKDKSISVISEIRSRWRLYDKEWICFLCYEVDELTSWTGWQVACYKTKFVLMLFCLFLKLTSWQVGRVDKLLVIMSKFVLMLLCLSWELTSWQVGRVDKLLVITSKFVLMLLCLSLKLTS